MLNIDECKLTAARLFAEKLGDKEAIKQAINNILVYEFCGVLNKQTLTGAGQ